MFRGREVFHPELGKKILDRLAERVDGMARVEAEPRLDGRNMVMVLAPDKRARQSAAARATRDGDGPAPEGSATEATTAVAETTTAKTTIPTPANGADGGDAAGAETPTGGTAVPVQEGT
jgi:translation initiation factor IF-3